MDSSEKSGRMDEAAELLRRSDELAAHDAFVEAGDCLKRAIEIFRGIGYTHGLVEGYMKLGDPHHCCVQLDDALRSFEEASALAGCRHGDGWIASDRYPVSLAPAGTETSNPRNAER